MLQIVPDFLAISVSTVKTSPSEQLDVRHFGSFLEIFQDIRICIQPFDPTAKNWMVYSTNSNPLLSKICLYKRQPVDHVKYYLIDIRYQNLPF